MIQAPPRVSMHDIERILQRDYSSADLNMLRQLIESVSVGEKQRVVAACLKIAAGSTSKLQNELSHAQGYYREQIAAAEYPGATRRISRSDLSDQELDEIRRKDWIQYHDWFTAGQILGGPMKTYIVDSFTDRPLRWQSGRRLPP